MRNLIQPIIKEIGTVTRGGMEYHYQTISYGTNHHIHVFRKQAPHLRGMVFESVQDYVRWKNGMHQLDLPL